MYILMTYHKVLLNYANLLNIPTFFFCFKWQLADL